MSQIVDRFCNYYQELTPTGLSKLDQLYSKEVHFIDPLHSIHGLESVSDYFEKMVANLRYCRFRIDDVIETNNRAFIGWIMEFSHPSLNKGRNIELPGSSYLKFDDLIFYHRDYYDLGLMIYQQIPLLRSIIRAVNKRMVR